MRHTNYFPTMLLILDATATHSQIVAEYCTTQHPQLTPASFKWISGESESIGIEEVRKLQTQLSFSHAAECSIYALLHAENCTIPAQNALLKILEEPPPHVQIVLTATQDDRLLPTIVSRCQRMVLSTTSVETTNLSHAQAVYQALQNATYAELILLAEKYSSKEEASALLTELSLYLHTRLPKADARELERILHSEKILLEHRSYLESNANVRLVLENCLFSLIFNK